jgi:hypothetical protein
MIVVLLGNLAPLHQVEDENGKRAVNLATLSDKEARALGPGVVPRKQSNTHVEIPKHIFGDEYVDAALTLSPTASDQDRLLVARSKMLADEHRKYTVAVHHIEELWPAHCADGSPSWVSVPDDQELEAVLANYFGCPRGEPTMLQTTVGRDLMHNNYMGTASATAHWGALTANATAASSADTSLTAEITTAGGGLIRQVMTFAHTSGTNTSTLTATWTANSSDSLPVIVAKWGSFNASSSGTMAHEVVLSSTVTLSSIGDSITNTFTLTAG